MRSVQSAVINITLLVNGTQSAAHLYLTTLPGLNGQCSGRGCDDLLLWGSDGDRKYKWYPWMEGYDFSGSEDGINGYIVRPKSRWMSKLIKGQNWIF